MLLRWLYQITGRVQGVGFRPFVFRLAVANGLSGAVKNSGSKVVLEVQGEEQALLSFDDALLRQKPELVTYSELSRTAIPAQFNTESDAAPETRFNILESDQCQPTFEIPCDVSTCKECLRELQDPSNRRYQYPFTHCASCGPRWSILEKLPFDRSRTQMRDFPLCELCLEEYSNPSDRRFHAQTLCCPECGPQLKLRTLDSTERKDQSTQSLIQEAVLRLKQGQIAAIKGMGGYQLWALASHTETIEKLRLRKHRPQKPFAVMVSSLAMAEHLCSLSLLEKEALASSSSPIVLLSKRDGQLGISPLIAPENPDLGLMLPASPLQTLLIEALGAPVVATSGNISDEPMAYQDAEAFERLHEIADFWVTHDRRIQRPLEDSLVRVVRGKIQTLRLGRGLAPLCLKSTHWGLDEAEQIAVGADLKAAVAFQKNGKVLLSETHGNLTSAQTQQAFEESIQDFRSLLSLSPEVKGSRDLHPEYLSRKFAPLAAIGVQHHLAHALGCAVEHDLPFPFLAVVWDGTGMGEDGTLWGGEFLKIMSPTHSERVGHLLPFPLLGGEAAIRDPRRMAFALLWQGGMNEFLPNFGFTAEEIHNWSLLAVKNGDRSGMTPLSSGMGRLFDGVSSLLDCFERTYQPTQYEGQAAMKLEFRARAYEAQASAYRGALRSLDPLRTKLTGSVQVLDWRPLIRKIVDELQKGGNPSKIAREFHCELIEGLAEFVTQELNSAAGMESQRVILAGGCFQNRLLLEGACEELEKRGCQVYWSQRVPIHDGGIAVGQLLASRAANAGLIKGNI